MLWFADNKGLATGIAVAGFGLAKAIASPLMEYLIGTVDLVSMFFILAVIYAVMMFFGFLLIKRPAGWVYDPATSHVSRKTILKKPVFWGIWIAFYINITCGLALISQEKDILHDVLRAFPQYANLSPAKFAAAISTGTSNSINGSMASASGGPQHGPVVGLPRRPEPSPGAFFADVYFHPRRLL